MPTTTFSANSVTSGDESLTVTVSGISGTVTGIDYEVDFTATNGSGVQCELDSDPDGNLQSIFGTGDASAGGSPYTMTASASTVPSTVNGDYEFSVSDVFFGSSGLDLTQIRVVVETAPDGLGDELGWWCPSISGIVNIGNTDYPNIGSSGSSYDLECASMYQSDIVTDTSEGGSLAFNMTNNLESMKSPSFIQNAGGGIDTGAFSFSGWYYSTNSGNIQFLFDTDGGWTFRLQNGELRFYSTGRTGTFAGGSQAINTWYHFALTVSPDRQTVKIYIDGSLDITDTQSTAVNSNGTNLFLGCQDSSTYTLVGKWDDFRVYEDELTAGEVSHLANSRGVTGAPSSATALEVDDAQASSESSETDASVLKGTVSLNVASETNYWGNGNKYRQGGVLMQPLEETFVSSGTYRFDLSDSSLSGHPLAFSETPNGTHVGGTKYTAGVTEVGTAGTSGAYVEITVDLNSTPYLYAYCENHTGMGHAPWDGEDFEGFSVGTTAGGIFGYYSDSETSYPEVIFNTYNLMGYDQTSGSHANLYFSKKLPSDGTFSYDTIAGSTGSEVKVYLDNVLQATHNDSATHTLEVTAGQVVKFTFANTSAGVYVNNLSLPRPTIISYPLTLTGSESDSEGQRAGVSLARPAAKVLVIDSVDSSSQALVADARVGGQFRPEDLRSISEVQTFYLYNTRSVTRTVNFW